MIVIGKFDPRTNGRAWFVTLQIQNFINAGLTEEEYKNPEYVAQYFKALWEQSGKERSCAISICMSEKGLYHGHMALYGNTTTLKKVSDILHKSHVELSLGGKKDLVDYITKTGKFKDSSEKVLYVTGIENIKENKGSRTDLEDIEIRLNEGQTPQEILDSNLSYYKYEKMILSAYIHKRIKEAPLYRDVYVEYHFGLTGSGKSYYYVQLCEKYSPNKIYMMNDYKGGGFDNYMKEGAPPILFMDEFKGEISYGTLLTILNPYSRMQTHARYKNVYNLWERVIITSVYAPEEVYELMVNHDVRYTDNVNQLLRRINKIVYHYKDNNKYRTYEIEGKYYKNREKLEKEMQAQKIHFEPVRLFSKEQEEEQAWDRVRAELGIDSGWEGDLDE